MSTDAEAGTGETQIIVPEAHHIQRVVLFQYPKVVFMIPSLITALLCGIAMSILGIDLNIPDKAQAVSGEFSPFLTKQNLVGVIFLTVLAINLIAMAVDFPRYSALALVFGGTTLGLIFLIVNDKYDMIDPLKRLVSQIYIVANATFYFLFATVLLVIYLVVFVTRWMDYWEIRANEIVHNHGPLSDQIRYPTFGLKFDKEIPDILEYLLLRSGRLVFKVPNENRSIVLENVLWIDRKEKQLEEILGEMAVRIDPEEHKAKKSV